MCVWGGEGRREGFHSRLTGRLLVSGDGALKRFKFATPKRRLRVAPQPRNTTCAVRTTKRGDKTK